MNITPVSLLDLPDELLLAIFAKLNTVDALIALDTVHHRLDSLLHDRLFARELNFTGESWADDRCSIDDRTLSVMCHSILPSIHHHVTSLKLNAHSMGRVLDSADFPQVSSLNLLDVPRQMLCQQLTGTALLVTSMKTSPSLFRKSDSHPSRHPPDHNSNDHRFRTIHEHRRAERCIRAHLVLGQESDLAHLWIGRSLRHWTAALNSVAAHERSVLVADRTRC